MVENTPHLPHTAPLGSPIAPVADRGRPATGASLRLARACLERAPLPSAIVSGAAHVLVFANAAFRQLSENVAAHAGGGVPIVDALPSAEHEGLNGVLDRVRRDGVAVHNARLGSPGGGDSPGYPATWCCDVWPVVEDAGRVDYLVITVRATRHREDTRWRQRAITERLLFTALRQQDLAQGTDRALARADSARKDAEQASQAKTSFLTSMSHELRTPLNAILGYTDLIAMGLRGPVTAAQQESLSRIQHAGRHLLGLINNVLNLARLKALQVRFTIADSPVSQLLDGAGMMVEQQASAKGLAFARRPCLPTLTVHGDQEKVLQILLNLLSNAIKFTDAGGSVTLAAVPCDRRRRVHDAPSISPAGIAAAVGLTVSDTGRGISPGHLETLFEPFVQVGLQLTGMDEGTGLGLAISRDLARGMGGDVTVVSTLGVGSTFTLTMPCSAPG